MGLTPGVAFADFVLALHVLGVVLGFGVVFAYPLLLAFAARTDPAMIPWLLRARKRIGRVLVNPGLTLVVVAGVYLAADEHRFGQFFVQWGIGAALVIGAIEGALIIPRAGRAAQSAERDLGAASVAASGTRTTARWSADTADTFRQLSLAGWAIQAIVVVTVFLMATHAGA